MIQAEAQIIEGHIVTAAEFREWRQRNGLTQSDAAPMFGVKRGTIQNWEKNEMIAIPSAVEMSCEIWEGRLRQRRPDLGPVTLIYTDNPMFINPYGPRRPLAMMKQEPYPTNQAAWARIRALRDRDDVYNPFIMEESGKSLWNSAEVARVLRGDANAPIAPLWRKVTIAKATRQEGVAEGNVNALIEVCSRAYRAKQLPKDVLILRDKSVTDDYVFYFSPAAFLLMSSEVRESLDSVAVCDEPDHRNFSVQTL